MWLIFARAPPPDAVVWPRRRWLAAVDAVVWPAMWVALVAHSPVQLGVVGSVLAAWAVWRGMQRLHCAVFVNQRYRFTTWRWGRVVIGLVAFGALLKFVTVH